MNGHEQFEEDLDLYALGALDANERQGFEAHLKECPECRRKLAEALANVAMIGLAEPLTQPAARAKERLFARLKPRVDAAPSAPAHDYWRWAALGMAAVIVALLVVAAIFIHRSRALDQQLAALTEQANQQQREMERARAVLQVLTAPETIQITLSAANTHPLPQGQAFYNARQGLLFYASNLAASPKGRTYQLWLVPTQGKPISAGVFNPDARGNAEVVLPAIPQGVKAAAFAVTLEPAGGVPQPTGPKVLIGAVS